MSAQVNKNCTNCDDAHFRLEEEVCRMVARVKALGVYLEQARSDAELYAAKPLAPNGHIYYKAGIYAYLYTKSPGQRRISQYLGMDKERIAEAAESITNWKRLSVTESRMRHLGQLCEALARQVEQLVVNIDIELSNDAGSLI